MQVPEQVVVERDAAANEPFTVIDEQPDEDLRDLLVSRYPQYKDEVMGGNAAIDALIRIRPTLLSWWSWS